MNTTDIAQQIYDELGDENDYSIAFITQWLKDNLGQFNNKTGNCINVNDTNELDTELTVDETIIFKQMFVLWWMNKQLRNVLFGITGSNRANALIQIKDGDSEMRFVNRSTVATNWRNLIKDNQEALDEMIFQYRRNRALPKGIYGDDATISYNTEIFTMYNRLRY